MLDLVATAAFGLEAVVDRELERLGYRDRVVENGRVTFAGDELAIARTNLWLRSADRILLQLGEFRAVDFGELFDRIVSIPWERWLPRDAAIPVEVNAIRSRINSPRSAQSIVKKAIVTRLGKAYGLAALPESGVAYAVDVAIRSDDVSVTLDTSGDGLHKRSYRRQAGTAPLRETLAAALVRLSFWRPDRFLADPFCGSGTIPIEAALWARNIAPGLNRRFAAEHWPSLPSSIWDEARREARDAIDRKSSLEIIAGDHDPNVIRIATFNARAAGVGDDVRFFDADACGFRTGSDYGCVIANPPYGERVGGDREVEHAARILGDLMRRSPSWSYYVLTADPHFEAVAGRSADRKRKLYNGRIECVYHQFHGPKPPRNAGEGKPGGGPIDRLPGRAEDDRSGGGDR